MDSNIELLSFYFLFEYLYVNTYIQTCINKSIALRNKWKLTVLEPGGFENLDISNYLKDITMNYFMPFILLIYF